jgi:methionine sulfoxide reductase heme-binding subunit
MLPIALGAIVGVLAIWFAFETGDSVNRDWQLAASWTARVGFPIFLITYSASSLHRVFPGTVTRNILRNRRYWGLGFAVTHSVHLFALIIYLQVSGTPIEMATIIGGGFAYFMLYAMALTSNDWAMARLDRNWKRLHRVGIHALWGIFVFTYFGRAISADHQIEGRIALALAFTALALRVMPRKRSANART